MNTFALLTVLVQAATGLASPLVARASEPDPSLAFSVTLDGQTFINKVCNAHNNRVIELKSLSRAWLRSA